MFPVEMFMCFCFYMGGSAGGHAGKGSLGPLLGRSMAVVTNNKESQAASHSATLACRTLQHIIKNASRLMLEWFTQCDDGMLPGTVHHSTAPQQRIMDA